MKRFFFTYGTEGQPFCGGWTEVIAPDFESACSLFRAFHPCKDGDLLNCAGVYAEEQMKKTKMYASGNFGHRAWETISVSVAYA